MVAWSYGSRAIWHSWGSLEGQSSYFPPIAPYPRTHPSRPTISHTSLAPYHYHTTPQTSSSARGRMRLPGASASVRLSCVYGALQISILHSIFSTTLHASMISHCICTRVPSSPRGHMWLPRASAPVRPVLGVLATALSTHGRHFPISTPHITTILHHQHFCTPRGTWDSCGCLKLRHQCDSAVCKGP